jgi:hypothetical protein
MNTNQKAELEARIKRASADIDMHKWYAQKGELEKAQLEAKLAALTVPPVTGRPFMKGVNEPEEGQRVYYMCSDGSVCTNGVYYGANFQHVLKMGAIYPTEADCIEGNKREEICKRYAAMGRNFIYKKDNCSACWDEAEMKVKFILSETVRSEGVFFDTKEACRAAIDAINAEYGAGAFEKYVLGVNA